MPTEPDFSNRTKEILAKRAGQVCSNPACRKPTSGPHTENAKAVNMGEAAHIRAARKDQARYDSNMTDKERSDISNGIWLCTACAKIIDRDEAKYPVTLLIEWKVNHERWILHKRSEVALREIKVKNGGIGSIIEHEGSGVGVDIEHSGKGPAEKITVEGSGVGEIISSTGEGIGKRVTSVNSSASETKVIVNKPINYAAGIISKAVFTKCIKCDEDFEATKVIQGFAGDQEPKVEVKCPFCKKSQWI